MAGESGMDGIDLYADVDDFGPVWEYILCILVHLL